MKQIDEGLNLQRKSDLKERLTHAFENVGMGLVGFHAQEFKMKDDTLAMLDVFINVKTIVGTLILNYTYDVRKKEIESLRFDNTFTFKVKGDSEAKIMGELNRVEKETATIKSTMSVLLTVIKKAMNVHFKSA